MQTNTSMKPSPSMKIDIIRILASLFWIGGAILTLVVALESFQQDTQTDNKYEIKCEIEQMEKQFQTQLEKLKSRL